MKRLLSIFIPLIVLAFTGIACPGATPTPMGAGGAASDQYASEAGAAPEDGQGGGPIIDDIGSGAPQGGTEAGNPYTQVVGSVPTGSNQSCVATKVKATNSSTNETIECPVTPPNCDFSCHVRNGPGWSFDLYNGDVFVAVIKVGETKDDAESSFDIQPGEDGVIDLGVLEVEGSAAYPVNMEEAHQEMHGEGEVAEEQGQGEEAEMGPEQEGLEQNDQQELQQGQPGIFYMPSKKFDYEKLAPHKPLNPDDLAPPENLHEQLK